MSERDPVTRSGPVGRLMADARRGGPTLIGLALIVGLAGGVGALAFHGLLALATRLATGSSDYGVDGRQANPHLPWLGIWFVLIVPVIGGLIYGPLVARFAPEARGHGVPEVMLAVARGGGRIRPRVAAVKAIASATCIGTGGSVGREGPIVQIGSAVGSTLGQALRMPERHIRLLVGCGAAAGIAGTFNAPVAGAVFALELILSDFTAATFGAVALSAVAADAVSRSVFGSDPFLKLPEAVVGSPAELLLYAALGVAAALVGLAFIRVLYGLEDLADRLWRWPDWLRPVVGGVLLGVLLLALPQMYGVGYPVLERAAGGGYVTAMLLVLLGGKILATSLTLAIGGSGGVFAPSLFIGGMLGATLGGVADATLPGGDHVGAFALVGMAAVFAAAGRAPMAAVLIVFELTGQYAIILPLLVAVVIATAVSRALSEDSIYTLKLRRRGIDLEAPADPVLARMRVREAMGAPPRSVDAATDLEEIVEVLSRDRRGAVVVSDGDGPLGTLVPSDVEEAARRGAEGIRAGDLARPVPELRPDDPLDRAADLLVAEHGPGLPVLGPDGTEVGWLTHRDVLRAHRGRRHDGRAPTGPPGP